MTHQVGCTVLRLFFICGLRGPYDLAGLILETRIEGRGIFFRPTNEPTFFSINCIQLFAKTVAIRAMREDGVLSSGSTMGMAGRAGSWTFTGSWMGKGRWGV